MAKRNSFKVKLKRTLRLLRKNQTAHSFAFILVPLSTFALDWIVATVIILPLFASPLIMVLAEWEWTRRYPYRMFDHKAGMGSFILYIVPFSILWWILAPLLLFE
jgi:hypothetical protein